ncbi:MAG: hypothetical protein H6Q69_824 [Firmicutes bacterium]|nr:hypothetical protein [Bacillota bacterium]
MAVSYTICHLIKFTNQDKYFVPNQGILAGVEILPESRYEVADQSFCRIVINGNEHEVVKYTAFQDVKQNKHGRILETSFTWYLEPHQFCMYYISGLNLMIIGTGKQTVETFLNQMKNDKSSGFLCEHIDVDFKKIQPLLPIISGAWFAELQKKKQYLKAAGYFGNHVDQSEEFKAAAEAGVISALSLPYEFRGRTISISITKNGAIVIYSRIKNQITQNPDVPSELELILNVYCKYIK